MSNVQWLTTKHMLIGKHAEFLSELIYETMYSVLLEDNDDAFDATTFDACHIICSAQSLQTACPLPSLPDSLLASAADTHNTGNSEPHRTPMDPLLPKGKNWQLSQSPSAIKIQLECVTTQCHCCTHVNCNNFLKRSMDCCRTSFTC